MEKQNQIVLREYPVQGLAVNEKRLAQKAEQPEELKL